MVVIFGKNKNTVLSCEKISDTRYSCGYSLTEVRSKDFDSIVDKKFPKPPQRVYIRTTPNDGEWLVYKFEGYNGEVRYKIFLNQRDFMNLGIDIH